MIFQILFVCIRRTFTQGYFIQVRQNEARNIKQGMLDQGLIKTNDFLVNILFVNTKTFLTCYTAINYFVIYENTSSLVNYLGTNINAIHDSFSTSLFIKANSNKSSHFSDVIVRIGKINY